ncbi:MAG: hypothetical protein OHK0029_28830 [Armatimonadaceae bacterium]
MDHTTHSKNLIAHPDSDVSRRYFLRFHWLPSGDKRFPDIPPQPVDTSLPLWFYRCNETRSAVTDHRWQGSL